VIIEGIGAALLTEKLPDSYKIFLQIDKETEFQRRLYRARSGADLSKERFDIRYEQFEIFILPYADKFDLKLLSQKDFSFIETI
jgi:uridine kinase